jgi:glycosyltransferase involved in cell wall biosynthesis
MKKPKKISLTVAIPAFNEEANIANVLVSLIKQKQTNFSLKEICVYSDGSTDKTVEIVKKLKKTYHIIKIIESYDRKGKNFRLNQIFLENSSEIVAIVDADIGILGNDFLVNLAKVLIADSQAQMVVAHQKLLKPDNFMGKLMYYSYLNWDFVRLGVPNQDHVQNFYGAATAYKKSFARSLHIPPGVKEERLYIYLMAKKQSGFRYTFASTIVYYPVSTWEDFMKLSRRSFGTNDAKLNKIFKFETSTATIIPREYRIRGYLKSLIRSPFYAALSLGLNLFISRLRPKNKIVSSSLWEITKSNKKAIIT